MKRSVLAIAIGAAGLLGVGVWLGHSASESASSAPGQAARAGETERAVAPEVSRSQSPARPALARSTPAHAGPGLESDLRDRDPKVRRAAVLEAAHDRDVDVATLLAASRDPDREVGVIATEALAKRYADGEVPISEMIARATDHGLDERVRVSAINGLGLVAHPDAATTLLRMLGSGDTLERRSAAILLAHQDPALAVPGLIAALGDADDVVRMNAHDALRGLARGRDFGTDAAAWTAWWQSRSR